MKEASGSGEQGGKGVGRWQGEEEGEMRKELHVFTFNNFTPTASVFVTGLQPLPDCPGTAPERIEPGQRPAGD